VNEVGSGLLLVRNVKKKYMLTSELLTTRHIKECVALLVTLYR
jgi:hypothetical protein